MSDMVEHKCLDYNAPLLSVRRFASPAPPAPVPSSVASTVPVVTSSGSTEDGSGAAAGEGWLRRYSLPFYKSELKSGPVRNPGVVPFVWEQTPGRPKDGSGASGDGGSPQKALQRQLAVVAAPKPPPSATLPIPSSALAAISTLSSAETRLAKSMQRSVEGSKGKANAKPMMVEAQVLEEDGGGSDEEDGDDVDAFSDGLDALSHTESCFMNCSTSGLSGGIAVRDPSGSFSTDAQVKEFMMHRFLPAAQAMTAGSPQLAARKPPVPCRDPAARRTLVDGGSRRPIPSPVPLPYPHQHRHRYAMYDAVGYHDVGFSGGRNSRGGDGRDVDAGRLVKGRGWLPSLCLKGSRCLLNPIPAMKVRSGHMVNCSDRRSEFTVAGSPSQRFEDGGFVVKAFAESPLQCRRSVLAPAPGDMCFVERPHPLKHLVTEEAPRTDHGCRPSKVEEHGKKEVDDGLEDLLPPALPQSPSESWLCQTLPSFLSRNPAPQPFFSGAQLHSKRQVMIRAASADPRWEAMAKTSALPKCGMRFADVDPSLISYI